MTEQFPPMFTIGECLLDRLKKEPHISPLQLAQIAGMDVDPFLDLLFGAQPITEAGATALERAFDVPSSFWMNLQRNYDEAYKPISRSKTRRKTKT